MPAAQNKSSGLPAQRPVSLWRNANYLLLWSGQTISNVGGGISLAVIGIILACGGIGAIIGSLLAPLTRTFLPIGRAIIVIRWLLALLWLGYALANNPFWLAAVEFSIGFVDPFEDVPYFSYRLSVIPDELRGRVIAACRIFTSLTNLPGQLLTGILIERYGADATIIIGWLVMSLVAFAFTLNANVRAAH